VNLYAVGKIVGCFGIKGYVKVQPFSGSIERYQHLHGVMIGSSVEETADETVEAVKGGNSHILVKLRGVDDRSSAEKIVGSMIFVDEKDVERPRQGSYFIHDIVGCSVYLPDGTQRGIVEDVYRSPAQDLWVIRYNGKLSMIPAVKEIVKDVDIQRKKIIIEMIEGLIEE
jgi:16S rRNA processing protein RimM